VSQRVSQIVACALIAGVVVAVLACRQPAAPAPEPAPAPIVPEPAPQPQPQPKPRPCPGPRPWGPQDAAGRAAGTQGCDDGHGHTEAPAWRLLPSAPDATKIQGILNAVLEKLIDRLGGIYYVGVRDGALTAAVLIMLAFALTGKWRN
jgi:hypothetical protein